MSNDFLVTIRCRDQASLATLMSLVADQNYDIVLVKNPDALAEIKGQEPRQARPVARTIPAPSPVTRGTPPNAPFWTRGGKKTLEFRIYEYMLANPKVSVDCDLLARVFPEYAKGSMGGALSNLVMKRKLVANIGNAQYMLRSHLNGSSP